MERTRTRRTPWAIVLLIIVLCCAIAYGASALIGRWRGSNAFASTITLQLDGAQKLQAVSDGFVYYDGNNLRKVDSQGQVQWAYNIGAGASMSATDAGTAAWTGRMLTIVDGKTGVTTYSGTLDGEILSAHVGKEYAAVLVGPEHNSTIVLMETGGRRVDSITLSDQTVIDYGFFYNDTLFWTMTLDTNGTAPNCTVSTYRPGRRLVGSISDSEQLLYSAMFQSAHIAVAGDTHLKVYTYNGTEELQRRKLIYGWTLAAVDKDDVNPMMAFTPNGQYDSNSQIREVRMIRGEEERIVRMPYGCARLIAKGDRVYGFSSEGYVMIARMDTQKVDAYQLPLYFDQVYGVLDDDTAVLGQGSNVYLVSLE